MNFKQYLNRINEKINNTYDVLKDVTIGKLKLMSGETIEVQTSKTAPIGQDEVQIIKLTDDTRKQYIIDMKDFDKLKLKPRKL